MLDVEFTAGALDDYKRAFDWYVAQSERAAAQFATVVEKGLSEVRTNRNLWPSLSRRIRFRKLFRFPYCLFYHVRANTVIVVAVAHGRRRPGYWKRRGQ